MSEHIPTTAELIKKHSQARVLVPSRKQFIHLNGISREMTKADAVQSMIAKYAR